jgi:hypothetical protein
MAPPARARTLLRHHKENGGRQSGWCRPHADAARLHWAVTQAACERGMGGQAGPTGLNLAHGF